MTIAMTDSEMEAALSDAEIPDGARHLQVIYVPHAHVHPDPDQPRTEADGELRASIAAEGILQPITVRPHPDRAGEYMIVDGERRWRGAAGVQDPIPVIVREDQGDDVRRRIAQLVANTGRPLTPLEEARAYREILERSGWTQTELAARLGLPRTTVGDRLRLLELGPWLDVIEREGLPVSHAIEHLVPVRGVPDKYHERAIEKLRKDYRWQNRAGGISSYDFGRLVQQVYRGFFYPLTKTKTSYAKQPEFNTKDHDAECPCGGIQFALEFGAKRRCCGNPDWWRPRHRQARATKAERQTRRAAAAARLPAWAQLPPEASARRQKYFYGFQGPDETVLVRRGRWQIDAHAPWDPCELLARVRPDQLVRIECELEKGPDRFVIVTTDRVAIAEARATYAAWREARRRELGASRRHALEQAHGSANAVTGGGVRTLLAAMAETYDLVEELWELAADVLAIEGVPEIKRNEQRGHADGRSFVRWVRELDATHAARLATAFASSRLMWKRTLGEELRASEHEHLNRLRETPIQWPGMPAVPVSPREGREDPDDIDDIEEWDDEASDADGEDEEVEDDAE
jgi:ParB/RepB/Spo0J family partition protein